MLDTNILVSALLNALGNEADVLQSVNRGLVQAYVSEDILIEYRVVLLRSKFARYRNAAEQLIETIRSHATHITPARSGLTSPDPDDTPFIDCAVAAKADYLVTGNKRHFPEQTYGGTTVVNARQLLDLLLPTP